MKLVLIVAMAENGVIGRDSDLPWHLPEDLRRFKRLTTGHPIIMGRKTWESIGRPLPKRSSIVLTRNRAYRADGAAVAHTLEEALELAREADFPARQDDGLVYVIGGAGVFEVALPRADRIELTRVHADLEGDVVLGTLDLGQWSAVREETHPADERHPWPYSFQTYERRR